MEINDRLDRFFKSTGKKQNEIAERLGYSPSYISKFATNREPNMDFFYKLVKAFPSVDMNYIIKGEKIEDTKDDTGVTGKLAEPEAPQYRGTNIDLLDEIDEKFRLLRNRLSHE